MYEEREKLGREAYIAGLPLNKNSNGYKRHIAVQSGPGVLYGFTVFNSNVGSQFIQVFDARDLPADGVVPNIVFTVAGSGNLGVEYLPGRRFEVGIIICNSTTGPTKTLGAADCWFDAQYL
jgi:hypothetical protein